MAARAKTYSASASSSAAFSNQASTSPLSLSVSGLPWRSTFLPSATRIQPSERQYSSTSRRSAPLKRMPMPRSSFDWSKYGLDGLVDRRSGGVSLGLVMVARPLPQADANDKRCGSRLPRRFELDATPSG